MLDNSYCEHNIFPSGCEFANVANLDDLCEGDWIVVNGKFNGSGGFDALEIGSEDIENEARVAGHVQGIGPAGVVLLGVSVYVNSPTTYFDLATDTWTDFGAITPGMAIEVRIPIETGYPAPPACCSTSPPNPSPNQNLNPNQSRRMKIHQHRRFAHSLVR